MAVKLELYRVFKEVADTGNISAAAKNLYISQSAVSQSIKQLETALQVGMGPGCVDKQQPEGEQAQDGQEDQDGIDHDAGNGQHELGLAAVVGISDIHSRSLLSLLF